MEKLNLTWEDVDRRLDKFKTINSDHTVNAEFSLDNPLKIYGVPRGGAIVAGLLLQRYSALLKAVGTAKEADVIVDDILDTGATAQKLADENPGKLLWVLCHKSDEAIPADTWVVFPWETGEECQRTTSVKGGLTVAPLPEGMPEDTMRLVLEWQGHMLEAFMMPHRVFGAPRPDLVMGSFCATMANRIGAMVAKENEGKLKN